MTELIRLSLKGVHGTYEVYYDNGVKLGEFIVNDDGYYVFFPENRQGYWDDYLLKHLAEEMIKLNKSWDDEIHEYFRLEEENARSD